MDKLIRRFRSRLFTLIVGFVALGGLPACEESPTGPEIPPEPVDGRVYRVQVRYPSMTPVENATVRIKLDGTVFTQSTGEDGWCRIPVSNSVDLPTFVIASIDHHSIMPAAITLSGAENSRDTHIVDCSLAPSRIYVKDVDLHHLGNDIYGGPENSQLQISTEGIEHSYQFQLASLPGRMPRYRIYARGVQRGTEIIINGHITNVLGDSDSDGSISQYDHRVTGQPQSILRVGTNILTIKTGANNGQDPWDDIEYCSLLLYQD